MATSRPALEAAQASNDGIEDQKYENSATENATEDKPPNTSKSFMSKMKPEIGTLLMMFKGALAPTIILAAFESTAYAYEYATLNYLAAVLSLLSLPILPRAKFLQSMAASVIFTCAGAAVALLEIQCAVAARYKPTQAEQQQAAQHTGSSGSTQSRRYDSSASVVSCVWLFLTIYAVNSFRAYRPQLMLPAIQYSILTIIASTYAPTFPTMQAGINFVERILKVFLTAFGVATGVSLFIIPVTSRTVVSKQMDGLLSLMKAACGAQGSYMQEVSKSHNLKAEPVGLNQSQHGADSNKKQSGKKASPTGIDSFAKDVGKNVVDMSELFSKVRLEMSFAKKEMAYGKLGPEDYSAILDHTADILQPLIGMSTFIDIMQSVVEHKEREKDYIGSDETIEAIRRLETEEWEEIFATSREPFLKLRGAMVGGLSHIIYTLEFAAKPKTPNKDVEENAEADPKPGDAKFAAFLQREIELFHQHRRGAIRRWCEKKGIELPSSFWDDPKAEYIRKDHEEMVGNARQKENQQQLYLILYIEYLLFAVGNAVLKMVRYADSKVDDGTMKHKRFIFPGWRRLRKLFADSLRQTDTDQGVADGTNRGTSIWIGDSLKEKKDPEHLPPANAYERVTHQLRSIPTFFASEESAYAFRAAVATLSIGILAFMKETWVFFMVQRGSWAMIMTAFSLATNSGIGMFGFLARIAGTAIAMVASIAIWYIGDQKPAAVIVVFFLYQMICIGFLIKMPSTQMVSIISAVTVMLIVGYELQELKLGLKATIANGQPYYKVYVLAPYRLAAVCAGVGVAFFWTYFPYPVTAHASLRKDLGSTLYLLANYYSCVHTTVEAKLHLGALANDYQKDDKSDPMVRLDRSRRKIFTKIITMLGRLREHSAMTKFEPRIGGRFPKSTYDELIQSMNRLVGYTSLMAYSANAFTTEDPNESEWLRDFRRFAADLNITSHDMTSTLCLVSASVLNSQALPPYLRVPRPFALSDRMQSIDPEILSVKHITEPCYAAFAVLEVTSSLITEQVGHVIRNVKELVGEVDFSFHVISTKDGDTSRLTTKTTNASGLDSSDDNDIDKDSRDKGKRE